MQLDRTLTGRDVDARTRIGQRFARGVAHRAEGSDAASAFERELGVGHRDRHRVATGEARGAERVRRRARRRGEAVELEVGERVDAEEVADLADRHVGGQQLGPAAGVHPVGARPLVGRRRHPEVHLGGAGLTQHLHHLLGGGAAHDGVVDHHELLAPDVLGQRVELETHALAALLLVGLDERAADVAVLHQAVAVGDAGGARVALRGGNPRLGDRHHHVGVDRRLARQLLAHALTSRVDALAVEHRVGTREVDELEQTELRVGFGEPGGVDARRVDHDHLARLDLAHEVGADDVERRGLAREHPTAFDATEHEGPEAVRVAHADQVRFVHHHEREAAGEMREHPFERDLELATVGSGVGGVLGGDQLGDERGIRGGVEPGVAGHQARQHPEALGQLDRVGEVPVVPEREAGVTHGPVHGLRVAPAARPGGGVPHVADGEVAVERREPAFVEHLGDQAHVLRHGDGLAVADRDAGRLLAPVLEGVEAQIGEVGDSLPRCVHAEDAARVADLGVVHRFSIPRTKGSTCTPASRFPAPRPTPAEHPAVHPA